MCVCVYTWEWKVKHHLCQLIFKKVWFIHVPSWNSVADGHAGRMCWKGCSWYGFHWGHQGPCLFVVENENDIPMLLNYWGKIIWRCWRSWCFETRRDHSGPWDLDWEYVRNGVCRWCVVQKIEKRWRISVCKIICETGWL